MHASDWQTLFNIAVGIAGLFAGWVMNRVTQALDDLKTTDQKLADELHSVRIELPSSYVSKPDFKDLTDAIFRKLDRIEEKIDGKADKA